MFKKHMKPLTKGGQTTVNQGKGSNQQQLQARNEIGTQGLQPGGGINNYAKATPAANPAPPAPDGLGSGNWPGIGE